MKHKDPAGAPASNTDVSDLESSIRSVYPSLSRGERKVANWVLNNKQHIALIDCTEAASQIGVSQAMVTRFAKALGFNGYAMLRKSIRSSFYTRQLPAEIAADSEDERDSYLSGYLKETAASLEQLAGTIDLKNADVITQTILDAEQIFLGGLGACSSVARHLFGYLRPMGFTPYLLVEEGHTLRASLLPMTGRDVLLLCCLTRVFPEEREMVRIAKERGATVIVITDSEVAAVLLESDLRILVPTHGNTTYYQSMVLPMAVCDLLVQKIYAEDHEHIDAALKDYHAFITEHAIDIE